MIHTINISNVFLLFFIFILIDLYFSFLFYPNRFIFYVGFISEMSDLTEGLSLYCVYFFTINDTVVFFFVKHIELLDVRNALYK